MPSPHATQSGQLPFKPNSLPPMQSRKTPSHTRLAYLLLILWAGISMAYYVAGVAALREEWFHGERHGTLPFDVDDQALNNLKKDAVDAGLAEGDILETLNGSRFTGDAQLS